MNKEFLMRAQYEILNIPLSYLASEYQTNLDVITKQCSDEGWSRPWPDDPTIYLTQTFEAESEYESDDRSELERQTELFSVNISYRLQVFNLYVEMYLAGLLANAKASLLQKAIEAIDNLDDTDAASYRAMSTVIKDLSSQNFSKNFSSLTSAKDDSGIPMVVIKDLSGAKKDGL